MVVVDTGQGLDAAAMVGLAMNLVVRDDGAHVTIAADGESFLQTVDHAIGLVAHMGDIAGAVIL